MSRDGAQLLGREPQGRQPQDAGRASASPGATRPTARGYAPSSNRSGPSRPRSSARSDGRDSRWSPSLTSVTCTSSDVQPVGEAQRGLPRHVGVALAVQQADRAVERDRRVAAAGGRGPSSISAAVIAGRVAVVARHVQHAVAQQASRARRGAIASHISVSVKSGAAAMPTRPATRSGRASADQQRDPAAHAGADQHQRALGQPVDQGQRVLGPARRWCRRRTRRRWRRGRNSRAAGRPGRALRRTPRARAPWRRSCRCGSPAGTPRSGRRPGVRR